MNVWRKQTTRKASNGERETVYSKRFYGTLRTANGKRKQVPLTEHKATSQSLLRRLQTDQDTKRANGTDKFHDDRQKPVGELLAAYGEYLAAKSNTPLHVSTCLARCQAILAATKAKAITDLDGARILKILSAWRLRKVKPISITTSNHYLVAIKSFSRWLWTEGKSPDDPLAGLRRMNTETDRRRVRRPLTPSELNTLLVNTKQSTRSYHGSDWHFTGKDRTMLYAIAAYTGLRANEIASLTKSSFDFAAMTWTLTASAAKNRKATTLPLSPTLATMLQEWLPKVKTERLFPGGWVAPAKCFAGKFIKRDLKRCGIAYVDAAGRFVDFHALRHTFITSLAKAGVHPAKAQRLARHSTVALTMNVYTTLDVEDLRDAIGAIK